MKRSETARPTNGALDGPTASFTYHSANSEVVRVGLDRLEQTIPYLYGTCDNLGQVRIRRPGRTVVFRRESPPSTGIKDIGGFLLKESIVTASEGAATRQFAAVSILAKAATGLDGAAGDEHASAGLLLILKKDDGQRAASYSPNRVSPGSSFNSQSTKRGLCLSTSCLKASSIQSKSGTALR